MSSLFNAITAILRALVSDQVLRWCSVEALERLIGEAHPPESGPDSGVELASDDF